MSGRPLTKNQQTIVDAMKRGASLTYFLGLRVSDRGWFNLDHATVNASAVRGLEKRGLIRALPYEIGTFRRRYVLTAPQPDKGVHGE